MRSIELSLARQAAFEEFRRSLPKRSHQELQEACEQLAELALVQQPAALSWLAAEAAEALSSQQKSQLHAAGLDVVSR